jgi:hypothetical protein
MESTPLWKLMQEAGILHSIISDFSKKKRYTIRRIHDGAISIPNDDTVLLRPGDIVSLDIDGSRVDIEFCQNKNLPQLLTSSPLVKAGRVKTLEEFASLVNNLYSRRSEIRKARKVNRTSRNEKVRPILISIGFIYALFRFTDGVYPGPQWRIEARERERVARLEAQRVKDEQNKLIIAAQKEDEERRRVARLQEERVTAEKARKDLRQTDELTQIAVALISLDRDPNKFTRESSTCRDADRLRERIKELRKERGVMDFNFWRFQTDMTDMTDADWNGGRREKGYIVDGRINAFELEASIEDYIQTCKVIPYIR